MTVTILLKKFEEIFHLEEEETACMFNAGQLPEIDTLHALGLRIVTAATMTNTMIILVGQILLLLVTLADVLVSNKADLEY